tara:strand:- start:5864 stop:6643 length:780 start_codon:yes stop_codon:yes gene_type:complete
MISQDGLGINMYEMNGKVALVTGGNSGMGKATALAFASNGAKVVIAARRAENGYAVAKSISEQGGDAIFIQTDVQHESSVQDLMKKIDSKFGRIDYAFNNAGVWDVETTIHEMPLEQWRLVIDVNLTGVFLCMKHELRMMIEQKNGSIVNNSSTSGLRGDASSSASYSASKHGVIGLTKTASMQNAQYGIRINAICPGWVDTPMVEHVEDLYSVGKIPGTLGRIGSSEEIAETVLWLCSEKASFITGQSLVVDGGGLAG